MPAQPIRVPSWAAHFCWRQPQAASGRTVAALAWAAAWASAKRRSAAMSRERGGIRQPEEQLTEAVRSRCPVIRIVHDRPGRRVEGASGYAMAKSVSPS